MLVPPASNEAWNNVVTGKTNPKLEFFAAKVLLARLVLVVKRDPAAPTVQTCAKQLFELFSTNAHIPSAQRDIAKIFGS